MEVSPAALSSLGTTSWTTTLIQGLNTVCPLHLHWMIQPTTNRNIQEKSESALNTQTFFLSSLPKQHSVTVIHTALMSY
jgi:hypothetical protein